MTTTENGRTPPNTEAAARTYVGHELRRLRLTYGLTQAELAAALPGVRSPMISAIECATRNVAVDTARAVLDLAKEYAKTLPTVSAPAEVDLEVLSRTPTIADVSAVYRAYTARNQLSNRQQAQLFGLSDGHLARVRRGNGSVSVESLRKILATIRDNPTATARTRPYVRRTLTQQPVTETPSPETAPAPPPVPMTGPSMERLATVVPAGADLRATLAFDGVTPHYFVKTQDGQVIVLRPRA